MVVIQCPYCEEDIELEDGVVGLFDCPLCGENFSYEGGEIDEPSLLHRLQNFMSAGIKTGLAVIALGAVSFVALAVNEGPNCTEFGCGMWIYIPCGIWAIGIPILVISFLIRGWQVNWEI